MAVISESDQWRVRLGVVQLLSALAAVNKNGELSKQFSQLCIQKETIRSLHPFQYRKDSQDARAEESDPSRIKGLRGRRL
ncbi:hypothetical protein TVAG_288600 [Trichomonas vaginalis G3]|uniref:Uncharacterized protein n=1 Tax=Trichomonas vaginalis (strain ATCC PRA-98 / G3) TaxID=412133 RepID=A2FEB9_TRIV3|nr:hypothetical protein TVAG_288600 [Trichomonas vaginalis G3]|eukprot:XP_001309689.1 hypothetical protein [Trichomonas vaginalis G3]